MRFEWDPAKDRSNRAKHGVSFETAKRVFYDPLHLSIRDRYEAGEERWRTMGMVDGSSFLLVAHTFAEREGDEVIRLISARKATRQERKAYEQGRA